MVQGLATAGGAPPAAAHAAAAAPPAKRARPADDGGDRGAAAPRPEKHPRPDGLPATPQKPPATEAAPAVATPQPAEAPPAAARRPADGAPAPAPARRQQRDKLLRRVLERVARALDGPPPPAPPGGADARPTSGVSYVVPSESRQLGTSLPPLPPLVFRPPGLRELAPGEDAAAARALAVLRGARAAAAVLPLPRDDAPMKAYLLAPGPGALAAAGGRPAGAATAADAVTRLAQDRAFVCLHYRLDGGAGDLLPVAAAAGPGGGPQPPRQQRRADGVADSDVQLGVMVRRGVGGTCPLRAAARALGAAGLLDALLGGAPPAGEAGGGADGAAPAPLEEEGADELLQELAEQQQLQQPAAAGSEPAASGGAAAQPPHPHHGLAFYTLSLRLELYVGRAAWEGLALGAREALHTAVRALERELLPLVAAANRRRLADFCRRELEGAAAACAAAGGGDAPPPPPLQLPPAWDAALAAASDYSTAAVLAAACAAARGGGGGGGGGGGAPPPWPLYLIGTRDHFSRRLVPVRTQVQVPPGAGAGACGRSFTRTEWHFAPGEAPDNYAAALAAARGPDWGRGPARGAPPVAAEVREAMAAALAAVEAAAAGRPGLLPAGVITLDGLWAPAALAAAEAAADGVDAAARAGALPEACHHSTLGRRGNLRRTKFFFGARYTWTREHAADPHARVAAGVRVDVPPLPRWARDAVVAPLAAAGALGGAAGGGGAPAAAFAPDSVALNVYHDGSEGIQAHFDDAARFERPIYSVRLFSDSRLSFGTTLFGYTNGLFCVPMPRGCVTVLEDGGYAAGGAKHCVRPADMAGRSAAVILRRIRPAALAAARAFHEGETLRWLRRLSLDGAPRADEGGEPGGGAGGGAGPPPLRARAAAERALRREVAAVLAAAVGAVAARAARERVAALAVRIALHDAVARVDAAQRLGVDLRPPGAVEVFQVVDSLVAFCEARPPAPVPAAPRRRPPAEAPPAKRPRAGDDEVAAAVVEGLVAAVERAMAAPGSGSRPPAASAAVAPAAAPFPAPSSTAASPARAPATPAPKGGLPELACSACRQGIDNGLTAAAAGGARGAPAAVWTCGGACRRSFHAACAAPGAGAAAARCADCAADAHACFLCGRAGGAGTSKCSTHSCGRFYHAACVAAHSLTRGAPRGARGFSCPLHHCASCRRPGTGAAMLQCLACPTAFHERRQCRQEGARAVSRKHVLCARCAAPRGVAAPAAPAPPAAAAPQKPQWAAAPQRR